MLCQIKTFMFYLHPAIKSTFSWPSCRCWHDSYRVANIARREEKVAASSFKALSSFLSFIMVSVTIAFSFSYLLFRLARATSAVCELAERTKGSKHLEEVGVCLLILLLWRMISAANVHFKNPSCAVYELFSHLCSNAHCVATCILQMATKQLHTHSASGLWFFLLCKAVLWI